MNCTPAFLWILASLFLLPLQAAEVQPSPRYDLSPGADPNGIDKHYLGRQIAHVMGHQGAGWLERPERAEEEKPDALVALLALKPGDDVADIGAGTGYISWRMAREVGPEGKVYAVDIQEEMLDLMQRNLKARGVTNVVSVLGEIDDPRLPENALDLVIMVDVYHEFSHPYEMMQGILRGLKPGGRVAFVEYRAEDPAIPIKEIHKMSEAQVKKEAAAAGLEWIETISGLPRQHLIIFQKPR